MLKRLNLLVVAGTLFSLPGLAFDPRTHLKVAQEVLNEVSGTGKITIDGKAYTVNARLVEALQKFPAAYRAGAIGPDAYPDLVVGQTTTHPGIEGGWQTDDFLAHIKANAETMGLEELAFAYGFYSHAAGDIFAHTYVNTYSGDYFELTDSETDVELRHFTLEKYLGQKTPALTDVNGASVGDFGKAFQVPAAFAAKTLILNKTVAAQYGKVKTAGHLAAMNAEYEAVKEMRAFAEELSAKLKTALEKAGLDVTKAEKGVNDAVEKTAATEKDRLFKQAEAVKLEPLLAKAQGAVQTAESKLFNAKQGLTPLTNQLAGLAPKLNLAQKQVNQVEAQLGAVVKQAAGVQKQVNDLEAKLPGLNGNVAHLNGLVAGVTNQINGFNSEVAGYAGKLSKNLCKIDPVCRTLMKKKINEVNNKIQSAVNQQNQLQTQVAQAQAQVNQTVALIAARKNDLTDLNKRKNDLVAARNQAVAAVKQVEAQKAQAEKALANAHAQVNAFAVELDARRKLVVDLDKMKTIALHAAKQADAESQKAIAAKNDAVGKLQAERSKLEKLGQVKLPSLTEFLRRWERDIVKASEQYILSAEQLIRNVLLEKSVGEILEPMIKWKDCWGPVFTGMPSVISRTECGIEYGAKDLVEKAEEMVAKAQEALFEAVPVLEKINDLKKEITAKAKDAAIEIGAKVVPAGAGHYYAVLTKKVTRDTLKEVFQNDSSGKQLIKFDDVATRVEQDMAMTNGQMDLKAFAPAANTINLVKMTLLGATQLNEVGASFGASSHTRFGEGLYAEAGFINVLHRAVRSIDGNHQWKGVGLPPLRRYGSDASAKNNFGYVNTDQDAQVGFRFWVDADHRDRAFTKVFQFPLAPNLKDVLPAGYPLEY